MPGLPVHHQHYMNTFFFGWGLCRGDGRGDPRVGCVLSATSSLVEAMAATDPAHWHLPSLSRRKECFSVLIESYYMPVIDLCTL